MKSSTGVALLTSLLLAASALACGSTPASEAASAAPVESGAADEAAEASDEGAADSPVVAAEQEDGEPDVEYTLITGGEYGSLIFVGVGGEIDGEINPTLTAQPGDVVKITLVNGDGILHDVTLDEFDARTEQFSEKDAQQEIVFQVEEDGEYVYYCSVPGHREAGMLGTLQVGESPALATEGEMIVHSPMDLPEPVGARAPELVRIDLTAVELEGQLADGTTFQYFTFNGTVPGPMMRVRVGDTVELHLVNDDGSQFQHSIDLHAVTGPGGGAVLTRTDPGDETVFTFKTLNPGLFVYHCATPSVAHHIANGMYGLILVEPEGGLPPIDHEFYVMQGEIYTEQPFGTQGLLDFSGEALLDESPEYFVFNGAAGALTTDDFVMQAEVGDTVRVFFGVGGPNFTSSFHVIGEIFDRVYDQASLTAAPLTDVQTTTVAPGGATMVEFTVDVPGTYILVDHALSRLERGLVGFLQVAGDENPDVYREGGAE